jgi:hypothetical protein
MERMRRQRQKRGRVLVAAGLAPLGELSSWEVDLVRDRIEAILGGHDAALAAKVHDAR